METRQQAINHGVDQFLKFGNIKLNGFQLAHLRISLESAYRAGFLAREREMTALGNGLVVTRDYADPKAVAL